jgi:hypothetical protein
MEMINLEPLKELTVEDVQRLVIHATRSSIRRAGAVKPMVVVAASEKVPTLYYVQEMNPETKEVEWSIHALSADVTRFLLLQSVNSANSGAESDEVTE